MSSRSTCGLAIPTARWCALTRLKPGRAARVDYEYERNGTANLFMLFAPLEGWRHGFGMAKRQRRIWLKQIKQFTLLVHADAAQK
jgi:hypothetical protein